MNNIELNRKLCSVGKKVFVDNYDFFESYANGIISKEQCINKLISKKVSNHNGAHIRCSNAKIIFESKMEKEALGIILQSSRINEIVLLKAQNILNEMQ
ncbi:hypothetical protein [Desulfogranum mediterraneum]|uniref:hypothetical protein n=1 Tax=Desulfogranum mediterraneum TaxID=160661 RepID=UPI00041B720F|nr:hypothetical protein [Desulfogranum mediterraneum]